MESGVFEERDTPKSTMSAFVRSSGFCRRHERSELQGANALEVVVVDHAQHAGLAHWLHAAHLRDGGNGGGEHVDGHDVGMLGQKDLQGLADLGVHEGVHDEHAIVAEHLGVVTRVAEEVAAHLLEASHFREYLQVGIGDAELGGGGARHHLGRLADGIGDDVDGGHASRALSRRLVMHYFFAIWEKSATWAKTLAKRFKSFRRFARTLRILVHDHGGVEELVHRRAQGRQATSASA